MSPYLPFLLLGAILATLGAVLGVFVYLGNRAARRAAWDHDHDCGNTDGAGPDGSPGFLDMERRRR
jgi:hypothetical protein